MEVGVGNLLYVCWHFQRRAVRVTSAHPIRWRNRLLGLEANRDKKPTGHDKSNYAIKQENEKKRWHIKSHKVIVGRRTLWWAIATGSIFIISATISFDIAAKHHATITTTDPRKQLYNTGFNKNTKEKNAYYEFNSRSGCSRALRRLTTSSITEMWPVQYRCLNRYNAKRLIPPNATRTFAFTPVGLD